MSRHVLVSEAVAVNVLAGITGSASGGLSIALDVMGQRYLDAGPGAGGQPRAAPPGRRDGLGRHGHAPAQRRGHHAPGDHGADPPAVLRDIFAITVLKTVTVFALAFAISLSQNGF